MKVVIVVALVVLVSGCGSTTTTSPPTTQVKAAWTPIIGETARMNAGSYAATSADSFQQAANASAGNPALMSKLVLAGEVVGPFGPATVKIIDAAPTTLTVTVTEDPTDPQLVGMNLWIDPSWVHQP